MRSRKAAVAITASHSALPRGTKTHVANSRHLPAIVGFDSFLCDYKIKCNETLVLGDGMGGRCIKKKQFFTCCDVMLTSRLCAHCYPYFPPSMGFCCRTASPYVYVKRPQDGDIYRVILDKWKDRITTSKRTNVIVAGGEGRDHHALS